MCGELAVHHLTLPPSRRGGLHKQKHSYCTNGSCALLRALHLPDVPAVRTSCLTTIVGYAASWGRCWYDRLTWPTTEKRYKFLLDRSSSPTVAHCFEFHSLSNFGSVGFVNIFLIRLTTSFLGLKRLVDER